MGLFMMIGSIVTGAISGVAVAYLVKDMAVDNGQFVHRGVIYIVQPADMQIMAAHDPL